MHPTVAKALRKLDETFGRKDGVSGSDRLAEAQRVYGDVRLPGAWAEVLGALTSVPRGVPFSVGTLDFDLMSALEHQKETDDGHRMEALGWTAILYVEGVGDCIAMRATANGTEVAHWQHGNESMLMGTLPAFLCGLVGMTASEDADAGWAEQDSVPPRTSAEQSAPRRPKKRAKPIDPTKNPIEALRSDQPDLVSRAAFALRKRGPSEAATTALLEAVVRPELDEVRWSLFGALTALGVQSPEYLEILRGFLENGSEATRGAALLSFAKLVPPSPEAAMECLGYFESLSGTPHYITLPLIARMDIPPDVLTARLEAALATETDEGRRDKIGEVLAGLANV